jgi:outer membrane protein, multidrug efflux system
MKKNLKSIGLQAAWILALGAGLSGCAMLDKIGLGEITQKFNPKATVESVKPPANWQATLPHGGEISNLNEFWQRYPDPILLELIGAAQEQAPTLATATANLAEARTNRIRSNATRLPTLNANASATRALQQPKDMEFSSGGTGSNQAGINEPTDTLQAGLQASWELDLYGANKTLTDAAMSQEAAAKAGWHEARVSVAAEVATSYFNYLLCQQLSVTQAAVASSSAESARLNDIAFDAGFGDASKKTIAQANAADAKQQARYQSLQCELEVKNLTALTFWPEPQVREKLAAAQTSKPIINLEKLFIINEIPAQVLAQRPDVYRAEANLITSAANIKSAAAARNPKVTLNGSIGWMHLSSESFKSNGRVWSLGPISITLPIFDGGELKANQDLAEARYVEAAAKYRGAVQTAVKEVENALVNLHNASERDVDVRQALQSLQANLKAIETKQKAGFSSMIDVEDAKRTLMQTQKTALTLQQARANAWLNLYRAAGGGWESNMPINIQAAGLQANINAPAADAVIEEIKGQTNVKQ